MRFGPPTRRRRSSPWAQGRWLPLDRLYTGLGDNPCKIAADEILTEVLIPEGSCRLKGVYLRYSQREVIDFPVVSVALAHYRQKKSVEFRIVAGGVAPEPKRLVRAEALLCGRSIEGALAEKVAAVVAKKVGPIKDIFYPSRFKRDVLMALVEDGIMACVFGKEPVTRREGESRQRLGLARSTARAGEAR